MPIKNYNELRRVNRYPPIILIIVVVPELVEDWVVQTEESLCLKRCGYWLSLAGAEPTKNQENITVSLPRIKRFNPTNLELIMQKILRGEKL